MQPQIEKCQQGCSVRALLKYGVIFLLILLSVLIVACGGAATTNADQPSLNTSLITATIQLGNNNDGITPDPAPEYWCGAWATQNTIDVNSTTTIDINAKYTHNTNGNPEGIGGASAIATVNWGSGSYRTQPVTTTSDGLAIFKIDLTNSNIQNILRQEIIVSVAFTATDGKTCDTQITKRNAFFVLTVASPTADSNGCDNGNKKHHNKNNNNSNCNATATPIGG